MKLPFICILGAGLLAAGAPPPAQAQARPEAAAVAAQPSAGQPSAGQPSAGQPSAGQPSAGQPSAGQPSTGLGFILLSVTDLEKAKRFYVDGLGLRIAAPVVHGSRLGIGINTSGRAGFGEALVLIQQIDESGTKGPIGPASRYAGPVGFTVSDLDLVMARIAGAGGKVLKPAHVDPSGLRKALLTDPDGVIVELLETRPQR